MSDGPSAERWEQITRLFHAAGALDGGVRRAFLDAACASDAAMRREIESLLDHHRDDGFLAGPAFPTLADRLRQAVAGPEPGEVLQNRYRLETRLASGGQAMVYRALDQSLSRPVVVKILRAEGRHDQRLQRRLRQESEALARIDHPGVVGLLDMGELADGSPFLVVQFIEGETLRKALGSGPLGRTRTAAILRQAGSALRAVHTLGIAHRDLKPENLMLQRLGDGSEAVKLIDFGVARIDRPLLEPAITTVMIAGTVQYMAPEQLQGENSAASDTYSLALIVCEMLWGHPDLRAAPAGLPRGVRRLLEAALAFRPEDRPANVGAWSEELAEALTAGSRRRLILQVGGAGAVLAAAAFAGGRWYGAMRDVARLIEYTASFDPLTEGFRIHNDLVGTIVNNADRTGYDGWRITTPRQGEYYRRLTDPQKRLALERGWKLTVVLRAEEGAQDCGVDLADRGPRFDIAVFTGPEGDLVRLITQILPNYEGLEFPLPHAPLVYRQYQLVYDASLRSAALWIDGKRVLSGYRGYRQFQERLGVTFGAAVYRAPRAMGTFQSMRFEINP